MKTKKLVTIAIFTMITMISMAQENEKRFGVELNGGVSFATRELGGLNLNTGVGFEGVFHYRFMQHLGAYAGWGWNKFSTDDTFAGSDVDVEETGYVLGLQFKHPIASSPLSYYVRLGGLYNHLEFEEGDDIIEDTGHGLGFQLAGGVEIELGSNWSINPGFKFNALSRDLDNSGIKTELDLNYINVRVGIIKRF
ncbi:MAG TPA: opacity protein [Bacteroidales bacterium]|nr:opacity protein [Bacteroidales bacterium]